MKRNIDGTWSFPEEPLPAMQLEFFRDVVPVRKIRSDACYSGDDALELEPRREISYVFENGGSGVAVYVGVRTLVPNRAKRDHFYKIGDGGEFSLTAMRAMGKRRIE